MLNLASRIYTAGLPADGLGVPAKLSRSMFRVIRRLVLKVADPMCEMTVRGRRLRMPLSHQLAHYVALYPTVDSQMKRLSDYLRARDGGLRMIDVGANIGDTIAVCFNDKTDLFLAIEPSDVYFPYLQANLGADDQNVTLARFLCAANDEVNTYSFSAFKGTGVFKREASDGGSALESLRIDTALKRYTAFQECNFLKIDTDGFDFEVIRGASGLIASAGPAVLFECHILNNSTYFSDVRSILRFFAEAGYSHGIVYDNLGYLFTVLDLKNTASFDNALLYQTISDRLFYDILVMKNGQEFVDNERRYFATRLSEKVRQQNAAEAIAALSNKTAP